MNSKSTLVVVANSRSRGTHWRRQRQPQQNKKINSEKWIQETTHIANNVGAERLLDGQILALPRKGRHIYRNACREPGRARLTNSLTWLEYNLGTPSLRRTPPSDSWSIFAGWRPASGE
jgi:hypothetical protein